MNLNYAKKIKNKKKKGLVCKPSMFILVLKNISFLILKYYVVLMKNMPISKTNTFQKIIYLM